MTTTSDMARLLMMQGTQLPDAGLGPVTNTTRAGRPNPMLTASQDAPRPNDYMAPVAELLSIPMGAYGAGQLVGSGVNAAREGDYASGAGQIALGMAGMLPMPKLKAFHASHAEFNKFKPSNYRGATYLASTPEGARRAAGAGAREYVMDTASEVPNRPWHIYEAEIDPSKVEGLALSPRQNEFYNQLPENISLNDYNTKWRQEIEKQFGTVPPWLYDESTITMPDGRKFTSEQLSKLSDAEFNDVVSRGSETLRRGDVPHLSYEDAAKTNRDIFGRQFSHYSPTGDEAKAAQRVLDSGMGAYLLQDEGGLSIAVADPSIANIVSRNGQPVHQGIRAFHGSPHDFDKFSMDAIGTGEGAQAYGHGLYFAEAEGTAQNYKTALAGRGLDPKDVALRHDLPESVSADLFNAIHHGKDDPLEAAKAVQMKNAALRDEGPLMNVGPKRRQIAKAIEDGRNLAKGHMYEVRINADPADFIDYDAGISGQPEKVRQALSKIADDAGIPRGGFGDEIRSGDLDTLRTYVEQSLPRGEFEKRLKDLGIPGIRYLDQMSRGEGKGSSNYVVFDDSLIEILRKYGLLGPVAGGGTLAGMLMGGQEGETY